MLNSQINFLSYRYSLYLIYLIIIMTKELIVQKLCFCCSIQRKQLTLFPFMNATDINLENISLLFGVEVKIIYLNTLAHH